MSRSFDVLVVGGDAHGLLAAIRSARAGSRVLLVEERPELGGSWREIEFTRGFRAAPLASDLGHVEPGLLKELGIKSVEPASDPAVVALADGEPLLLHASASRTAEGLRQFSAKDADRWPAFTSSLHAFTQFLYAVYSGPAPRIDASTLGEYAHLAKLAWRFRGLGKHGSIEFMRALPMSIADLLDDWFENDRLKGALAALACADVCQGPMASGTAFTFMHRHVGAREGVFGQRLRHKEGPQAIIRALEARARALGVTIETGSAVRRLQVKESQVTGATLASGEEIACPRAISSLDPYRSLLELVDPAWLDPEFILSVRNIRFRGVTTKILLALDGLPNLAGVSSLAGTIVAAPSTRFVERAYDAAKYGRASGEPVLEVQIPSVVQPHLAPAGQHVAVVSVQYTPYRLRESGWDSTRDEIGDRALALLERYWPGFGKRVLARKVMAPPDLETELGVREGSGSQGELMLDQILFMRPVPGAARGETPIAGFTLCGPGTHPGPGLLGV